MTAFAVLLIGAGFCFAALEPAWPPLVMGACAVAVGTFHVASVLLHEAARQIVRSAAGGVADHIVLHAFGGRAALVSTVSTTRGRLLVALAGPVVSGTVGGLATWAGLALADGQPRPWSDPSVVLFYWVALVNITLAGVGLLLPLHAHEAVEGR